MVLDDAKTIFKGRSFLLLGLGGLGKTYIELLDKLLDNGQKVCVVDSHIDQSYIEKTHFNLNIDFVELELTKANYRSIFSRYLSAGDILLNFTNTCDSRDLIEYCFAVDVIYQDTAWSWWRSEETKDVSLHKQDQLIQKCKEHHQDAGRGFALVNFGINPGLISIVAKSTLDKYKSIFGELPEATRIYFTEYDAHETKPSNEKLVCTWSPIEFWNEFVAPAEFYLRPSYRRSKQKAAKIKIAAWSKSVENYIGFLVPHREVFSFVNSLNDEDKDKILFSGFCYHPPEGAVAGIEKLSDGNSPPTQDTSKLIVGCFGEKNYDEIGVLIGSDQSWVWSGYSFHLSKSPLHCVSTNSTLYLVAAAAFCGLFVGMHSGKAGVLESEDLDATALLNIATSLIGNPETLFPSLDEASLTHQFSDFM